MQDVLHFSALRAGAAYVPAATIVAVGAGGSSGLISRIGTRPLIVAGALIAAGGISWVSRIPAHGYYWTDIFPAMMVMGIGLGAVFVGVQTAANAGVPADKAGLAGALINASFQVGGALGLAIFSALATARTRELLAAHAPAPAALAGGYARALLAAAIFVAAAAVIGLRTANTKGEPAARPRSPPWPSTMRRRRRPAPPPPGGGDDAVRLTRPGDRGYISGRTCSAAQRT